MLLFLLRTLWFQNNLIKLLCVILNQFCSEQSQFVWFLIFAKLEGVLLSEAVELWNLQLLTIMRHPLMQSLKACLPSNFRDLDYLQNLWLLIIRFLFHSYDILAQLNTPMAIHSLYICKMLHLNIQHVWWCLFLALDYVR